MTTPKRPTAPKKTLGGPDPDQVMPRMPAEVAAWIEQATSRMAYMRATIDRLTEENRLLKAANRAMELRVMGSSRE